MPLPNNGVTKTAKGDIIWTLPDFNFLAGDAVAPDTEAPAEMLFYIPRYKALTVAEDATFTMHNVCSLRGTPCPQLVQLGDVPA
jgi:alkyl sulfatase BDS1-like metallo-beta-lactamase superfamily hydrolase